MPYVRTVGDVPEPVQYGITGPTHPLQFTSTYANAFDYHGLRGLPAYEAALRNGYFQVAYFDGSTPIGVALQGEMPAFGYRLAATVRSGDARHTWWVWQRFTNIS